jgi:alkylation response protein AidB-like acyl-CoA dehydrogenase
VDHKARLEDVLAAAGRSAREVDATGGFPDDAVKALRASGLLGLTLPAEVGGLGGGPHELVEVITALAEVCGSTAMISPGKRPSPRSTAASPPTATTKPKPPNGSRAPDQRDDVNSSR